AGYRGDGLGGGPLDRDLHVMNRVKGRSGWRPPPWIVRNVLAGVPAVHGKVDAADEGDLIIDRDDLLVLGRVEGVGRVEPDMNAGMLLPCVAEKERQHRAGRVKD